MGCSSSARKFQANDNFPGQDEEALQTFWSLGLSQNEIDKLFYVFNEIDVKHTGSIQPIEFFIYFNMSLGDFEKHIFGVFDLDNSGVLSFLEFVCSVWNLLTLADSNLGQLIYLIKDPTGILRIRHKHAGEILEVVHRRKIETSTSLQTVMLSLKNNFGGEISMSDFCNWILLNPSVLSPVLVLQLKLRRGIIGEGFWVTLSEERKAHPERSQFLFMKKLQEEVKMKCELNRKKQSLEDRRQAMESRKVNRNASERKQSLLLNAFNMVTNRNKKGTVSENSTTTTNNSNSNSKDKNISDAVNKENPNKNKRSTFIDNKSSKDNSNNKDVVDSLDSVPSNKNKRSTIVDTNNNNANNGSIKLPPIANGIKGSKRATIINSATSNKVVVDNHNNGASKKSNKNKNNNDVNNEELIDELEETAKKSNSDVHFIATTNRAPRKTIIQ